MCARATAAATATPTVRTPPPRRANHRAGRKCQIRRAAYDTGSLVRGRMPSPSGTDTHNVIQHAPSSAGWRERTLLNDEEHRMRRLLAATLLALIASLDAPTAWAQATPPATTPPAPAVTPAPRQEDVASEDAIIAALYASISGPAG